MSKYWTDETFKGRTYRNVVIVQYLEGIVIGSPEVCSMAEEKLVSIILINWNSYGLTSRCIENIRKNTDYPNYEVWVVDNGSRDGSFEGLKRDFPFLKTIKNEKG